MLNAICYDQYGNQIQYFTQWDVNQKLHIDVCGYEFPDGVIPTIHFSNKNSELCYGVKSVLDDNGRYVVSVPNLLLKEPYNINIYIFIKDGDMNSGGSGKTLKLVELPVRKRIKPSDYEYVDNVEIVDLRVLTQDVNTLKENVGDVDSLKAEGLGDSLAEMILNEKTSRMDGDEDIWSALKLEQDTPMSDIIGVLKENVDNLNVTKLEKVVVGSLPSVPRLIDFENGKSQFVAKNRCTTVAFEEENGNICQKITSASNASKVYSYAYLDLSSYTANAEKVTISFDSKIAGDRWYIGLSDLDLRPGDSNRATYDTTGVIFHQGTKNGKYYFINGNNTWENTLFNTWVHSDIVVDFKKQTVTYKITGNDIILENVVPFVDSTVVELTALEIYSYVDNATMYIDNIEITSKTITEENTIYLIPTDDGYNLYMYIDGVANLLYSSSKIKQWDKHIKELKKQTIKIVESPTFAKIVTNIDGVTGIDYQVYRPYTSEYGYYLLHTGDNVAWLVSITTENGDTVNLYFGDSGLPKNTTALLYLGRDSDGNNISKILFSTMPHTHDNKGTLDNITSFDTYEWSNKLGNLNNYKVEYDSEYGIATIANLQGSLKDGYYLFTSEIDIGDINIYDEESDTTITSAINVDAGQTIIVKVTDNELVLVCGIVDKEQYASATRAGIVKVLSTGGLGVSNGGIYISTRASSGLTAGSSGLMIAAATEEEIKTKTQKYKPITPATIDTAVVSSAHGQYSVTPIQIGNWLDGNPIYRVAIPIALMSENCIVNDANYKVFLNIETILANYVQNTDNVIFCNINNIIAYSEYPAWTVKSVKESNGYLYFCDGDESTYTDLITDGNGRCGGYIEFVTPASNIVTTTETTSIDTTTETDEISETSE